MRPASVNFTGLFAPSLPKLAWAIAVVVAVHGETADVFAVVAALVFMPRHVVIMDVHQCSLARFMHEPCRSRISAAKARAMVLTAA